MNILRRASRSLRYRSGRLIFGNIVRRKVSMYLASNDLNKVLDEARSALESTGADDSDYVLLHSYIRTHRPKYVLECGTGLTTW